MKTLALVPLVAASLLCLDAPTAHAQEGGREQLPMATGEIANQRIVYRRSARSVEGGAAGECPQTVSAHTNASFTGGSYIVQAGFVESEVAACSYTIPAGEFPIRLDLAEMIFATSNAVVSTTTKWTIMVWSGTPATGELVFQASSDGEILPHLVMPPGTSGTNIQFLIDPADPEQIYINDNGSHTFSIGYRIDDHHSQSGNGCSSGQVPSNFNAFPTTDTSGLAQPTQNWLKLFDCGPFGCGSGWKTFSQLNILCRPSGDWVMRATWTSLGSCGAGAVGACCEGSSCSVLSQADCQTLGGVYQGDNVLCNAVNCVSNDPGPCCFAATGGCLNLLASDCTLAGGVPGPAGVSCTGYVCFPTGACCLPDGTCVGPVSPEACAAQGGTFKGNGTSCATVSCPLPTGAACFPTGFCLQLTEADALAAGASWGGPGSTCSDANSNGVPDGCESRGVPGDLNGDGTVNGADLGILLAQWGGAGSGDLDGDGSVNGADLGIMLSNWSV